MNARRCLSRLTLFLKAYQPGLFDDVVGVAGHVTKRGTVVQPYRAKRKKRPESPPATDWFAARKPEPQPPPPEDPGDDDPTSPNYRFRDTGYIPGSRKEDAANLVRRAGRERRRLRPSEIDWAELETNPREAVDVITKSNLFGEVDWNALRDAGMEPGAGYLTDRVYASIGAKPDDNPTDRQRYAEGVYSLRDRMERCRTVAETIGVLTDIREEMEGTFLTADQVEELQPLEAAEAKLWRELREKEGILDALGKKMQAADIEVSAATWEQEKRLRRNWKPDPDLDERASAARAARSEATTAWESYRAAHPELITEKVVTRTPDGREISRYVSPLHARCVTAHQQHAARRMILMEISRAANPQFQAWTALGPRFIGVLRYRAHDGSDAFAQHVARARAGKIKDWSWAETTAPPPKVTEKEKEFALKIIDTFERRGGRAVSPESTAQLKKEFGLRDVQSGNWVLHDPVSAAWHVRQSAEAFADLADLLGVPDAQISMKGRLALAFGARGKGNQGFRGAARAHYEPVHRIINITKMGGGGCLAHEWFHALDNLIVEAEGGTAATSDTYATERPDRLPAPVAAAFGALIDAMGDGPHHLTRTIAYTNRDWRTARLNLTGDRLQPAAQIIANAPNVHAAVRRLEAHFDTIASENPRIARRADKKKSDWVQLAVAHFGGNAEGGTVDVETGPGRSRYQIEAILLDHGREGRYWSSRKEMAARAFQSYVEDRLAAQDRRSDYLSALADNRHYLGEKPFPEGNERERIDGAFEHLFAILLQRGSLQKALRMAPGFLFARQVI